MAYPGARESLDDQIAFRLADELLHEVDHDVVVHIVVLALDDSLSDVLLLPHLLVEHVAHGDGLVAEVLGEGERVLLPVRLRRAHDHDNVVFLLFLVSSNESVN